MNQIKKKQENIKFSKLRLRSSSIKPKKSYSPHPREKISSYFGTTLNKSESISQSENVSEDLFATNTESQNAQKLPPSQTNNINDDDNNDFIETKSIKPAKIFEIKSKTVPKKHAKSTSAISKNNIIIDPTSSDTNQEHLQLAIAMSRSLKDLENPTNSEERNDSVYPSTQEKISTIKKTLDEFGFKSDKSATSLSTLKPKTRQNRKKFKYLTPTLFLRTEEDRTKLIENRVSQIITNISIYNKTIADMETPNNKDEYINNKPISFLLRDYYDEDSTIFNKNSLSLSEMHTESFYNTIVSPTSLKAGVLLKDWNSIPGREKTPPLEINAKRNNSKDKVEILVNDSIVENNIDDVNTLKNLNMSPDLFSDSDSESIPETNNKIKYSFPSQLSDREENSDNSEAKSLSLLDNISPKRNKLKSPKKLLNRKSNSPSCRKNIFQENLSNIEREKYSISLLDNVNPQKNKNHFSKKDEFPIENSQICHYESYCDNNYFDLTRSSDDSNESMKNDNTELNKIISNSSAKTNSDDLLTVTQLLNNYSPSKDNKTEEVKTKVIDLTQSSKDSVETVKYADTEKNINSDNENYSPEFDCFDSFNNKEFYDSLNKTTISSSDNEDVNKLDNSKENIETSPSEFCYNKLYDDDINIVSFLGHVNRNEISTSPIVNRNKSINKSKSNKSLRKSFSENMIIDKELHYTSNENISSFNNKSFLSQQPNKNNSANNIEEINYSKFPNTSSLNSRSFLSQQLNQSSSIDDIEISDEELNYSVQKSKFQNDNSHNPRNDILYSSQSTIGTCSDISDEELNYSSNTPLRGRKLNKEIDDILEERENINDNHIEVNYMDFNDLPCKEYEHTRTSLNITDCQVNLEDISVLINNISNSDMLKHPRITALNTPSIKNSSFLLNDSFDEIIKLKTTPEYIENENLSPAKTPENCKNNEIITPNSDVIIKKTNITPMANYSDMDTPVRNKELDKFGLKPLKRSKGVKILRYIYDATHPVSEKNSEEIRENSSDNEDDRVIKRRKKNVKDLKAQEGCSKDTSKHKTIEKPIESIGNKIAESETVDNMIFERKQSSKILSCRLPFHIAWHNFISTQHELQEKILLYEPLQVEEIYAKFKSFGYKFHIQDIISFLDKKCITIRIAQTTRNKRKAGPSSK